MNAAELKTIRLSLGITAKYLADLVGVSERTIRNHESGEVRVSEAVAKGILDLEEIVDTAVFEKVKELLCYLNCPIEQEHFYIEINPQDGRYTANISYRVRRELMSQGATVTIDYEPTDNDNGEQRDRLAFSSNENPIDFRAELLKCGLITKATL